MHCRRRLRKVNVIAFACAHNLLHKNAKALNARDRSYSKLIMNGIFCFTLLPGRVLLDEQD